MSTERTFDVVRSPRHSIVHPSAQPTAIELGHDTAGQPLTPRQSVLQTMWRRRGLVLLALAMGIGGGLLYLSKATPMYTSSSRLLVERSAKVIATSVGLVTQSKNYLHTQCELMKSTPILSGSVKLLESRRLRTFDGGVDRIGFLKNNLKVTAGRRNDIITVALNSPYPQEAAELVNAIVESYVTYQSRQQQNTAAEILKILQREKVRRGAELKEHFEATMAFKRENEIISFGTDRSNIIVQRLDTLSDALTRAEMTLMEAKARRETAKTLLADPKRVLYLRNKLLGGAGENVWASASSTLEDERSKLKIELTALVQEYTENHPAVQTVRRKIEQFDEQQADRIRSLTEAHLSWLEQEVIAASSHVADLKKTLEDQRKLAQELNSKAVEYAMLEAEQRRAERICDILDSRIKEIDITDDTGALHISLLETGRAADAPSYPRKARVMGLSLALGLFLGFVFALLREWMDHRLRSAEEVSEALGLPILGVVPQVLNRKGLSSIAKIVALEPSSHAAEAYRTLRTAVYFGAPDIETKTLLVTSPGPNDGKTSVVSNLGVAMAHAGQKVLILDADFRKPNQQQVFQIDAKDPGINDVLAGQSSLHAAVHATDVERLDVLPCGTIPPNPADTLNSVAFGNLLGELAQRYDRILIDAPPVLSLADSRILGARCDAALLVLRANQSSRRPSQQAVESLLSVGARILGVVVNGIATHKRGYGYDSYGYYYGHYRRALEVLPDDGRSSGQAQSDAA